MLIDAKNDRVAHWYAGYGEYMGRYSDAGDTAYFLGRPRWLLKQLVMSELRYRVHRPFSAPAVWMEDLIAASTARGQLKGHALRG